MTEDERIEMFLLPEDKLGEKPKEKKLKPEFFNEIMPPILYKTQVSGVELSRSILNCSLCANVTCKSKKKDISLARKPYTFILDKFTDGNLSDPEVFYVNEVAKWIGLNQDNFHITGTIKCDGGDDSLCSMNMIQELDFYEDDNGFSYNAVIFSDKVPSIFSNDGTQYMYYHSYYVGKKLILFLPSIKQLTSNEEIKTYSMNTLWNFFHQTY